MSFSFLLTITEMRCQYISLIIPIYENCQDSNSSVNLTTFREVQKFVVIFKNVLKRNQCLRLAFFQKGTPPPPLCISILTRFRQLNFLFKNYPVFGSVCPMRRPLARKLHPTYQAYSQRKRKRLTM